MIDKKEKKYLRYSYTIIIIATLIMICGLLNFLFLPRLFVRSLFFILAYIIGGIMYFLIGIRNYKYGKKEYVNILFILSFISEVVAIIYTYLNLDSILEVISRYI